MFFHNSGIDFWKQNPSKINCKMTSKIAYLNLTHFGLKIRHKIPPRGSQDAHMTPQDAQDAPTRPQNGSRTPPRRPQDASQALQDTLKTPSRRLKASQNTLTCFQDGPRRPKTPPRRLQDASRPRFLTIFD